MQPSEMFVYAWSIGATVVALYYYVQFNKADEALGVMMKTIVDIHNGEATITMHGSRVTIKYKGEDDGNTSKQD
jgi:hypothetical protein